MTIILCILLLAGFSLAIIQIGHGRETTKQKVILLGIRAGYLLIILGAFLQPSFTFNKLITKKTTIPILIDNSRSMQLFNTDSIITTFQSSSQETGKKPSFSFNYFAFGDSLRLIKDLQTISFKDNKSEFPPFFHNQTNTHYKKAIIISDGNWATSISVADLGSELEYYYFPLNKTTQASFLQLEAPRELTITEDDRNSKLTIIVSGSRKKNEILEITGRVNNQVFKQKQVETDQGYFSKTLSLEIPSLESGTHLIDLKADLKNSTITTNRYILLRIISKYHSAYMYAARSILDKRFLTLSLKKNKNWRIVRDLKRNTKVDMFFLFHWDDQAQRLMNRYPLSSFAFFGCHPEKKQNYLHPNSFTPQFSTDYKHILSNYIDNTFPPPTAILSVSSPSAYKIQRVLMSIEQSKGDKNLEKQSTPIMFDALFRNKLIFILAIKDLWHWDFWPKSLSEDSLTQAKHFFSDFVIDYMETIMEYNTNKSLYVFPDISPIYETDSASFKISFPAFLQNIATVRSHFFLTTVKNDTIYNKQEEYTAYKPQFLTRKIPPLKPGVYTYNYLLSMDTGIISYSDSLRILPDNSELHVRDQNTILLNEIAQPLALENTKDLDDFLNRSGVMTGSNTDTIFQTFRLNRSWIMLIVLLVLLCSEWVLRRIWKFD